MVVAHSKTGFRIVRCWAMGGCTYQGCGESREAARRSRVREIRRTQVDLQNRRERPCSAVASTVRWSVSNVSRRVWSPEEEMLDSEELGKQARPKIKQQGGSGIIRKSGTSRIVERCGLGAGWSPASTLTGSVYANFVLFPRLGPAHPRHPRLTRRGLQHRLCAPASAY